MLPDYLTHDHLTEVLEHAIEEDIGPGDVTTLATVPPDQTATAVIRAKEAGVVAGLEAAACAFAVTDRALEVSWNVADGTAVESGQEIGTIAGPAQGMLTAERPALNLMQRMSGIATATHRMVDAARPHGTEILDTRKTAPGLRRLDKWAVRLGGGTNHRIGLYDLFLIKDNHIAAAGGVAPALDAAQTYRAEHAPDLAIEIETRTLGEVRTAAEHGAADILLLDNMVTVDDGTVDTSMLRDAVALVDGRCRTEASGNVTLATVPAIAETGVDALSSGALTHSVTALDLSMKIGMG
jgi:nicotinate-nucleotide pyrophosphorylase (carboxylating)